MSKFVIQPGFDLVDEPTIAQLYWAAFGAKLNIALGPQMRGRAFIADVLDPRFALVARDVGGTVLGVAGFKTHEGALVGGGLQDLARHYRLGAIWRAPLLMLVDRPVPKDLLLMDGICVAEAARGRGVGTALLNAVKAEAAARQRSGVRLDVIDGNDRAKALYLRKGFVETGRWKLGPLRRIFGFGGATTMVWSRAGQRRSAAR